MMFAPVALHAFIVAIFLRDFEQTATSRSDSNREFWDRMLLFGRIVNAQQARRALCLAGVFMACSMGAAAEETNSSPAPNSSPQSNASPAPNSSSALPTPSPALPDRHPAGPVHEPVVANPPLDLSGNKRRGKASFYARKFSGRKMADGTIMQPQSNNAASKTLPLGTTAKVTNLETGQSAVVTIRDRGPYIQGRIVDLSPSTAQEIGIDHKNGVARVEVAPIVVPLGDGRVKLGAAAAENNLEASND
jgi:rare lipoprotein A